MGLTDYGRFTGGLLTDADVDEFTAALAPLATTAKALAADRANRQKAVAAAENWAGAFATLAVGLAGIVETHISAVRGAPSAPAEKAGIRDRIAAQIPTILAGGQPDIAALLG